MLLKSMSKLYLSNGNACCLDREGDNKGTKETQLSVKKISGGKAILTGLRIITLTFITHLSSIGTISLAIVNTERLSNGTKTNPAKQSI